MRNIKQIPVILLLAFLPAVPALAAPLIDEKFETDTRADWSGINIAPLTSDYYEYLGGQNHQGFGTSRVYAENDHVMFRGNAFTRHDENGVNVAHSVLFQTFAQTDITNVNLTRSVHYQAGGFPTSIHFTRLAIRFNDGSGDRWAIGDLDLWTTKRGVGEDPWGIEGGNVIADPTTTLVSALATSWTLLDPLANYAPAGAISAANVLENANAAGVYFRNEGNNWDNGYALDQFVLVPEPSTLVLLGISLVSACVFRRRKRG